MRRGETGAASVSASRGEVMESTYSSGKRLDRVQSRPKLCAREGNNRDTWDDTRVADSSRFAS